MAGVSDTLTEGAAAAAGGMSRRRKIILGSLGAAIAVTGLLLLLFLRNPQSIPDLIPLPARVWVPPHYRYSINGVQEPAGVAMSPDGKRVYVTETGGDRRIIAFDRTGKKLRSWTIPNTQVGSRAPVYIAVSADGRVFVADRIQQAVYVFTANGKYIDEIIGPRRTMTGYLAEKLGTPLPKGLTYSYDLVTKHVLYQIPGKGVNYLPAPAVAWSPLGVRFDKAGNLFVTDVGQQCVHVIPAAKINSPSWVKFNNKDIRFGAPGAGKGELDYPNVAQADSSGRVFVTDGNNGRISAWDLSGKYVGVFGLSGDGEVGLPRGEWVDAKDRLYVVDAVNGDLKVYDVSGGTPSYMGSIGEFGIQKGQFNFPNDVVIDRTGTLFIADRVNNRVQVWSN